LKLPGRNVGLGVLFFAALFLDFLLGGFVLLGQESMSVPANYRTMADATFDFPWSHGLVASLGWSMGGFILIWLTCKHASGLQWIGSSVVAAAIFSHFILDALVHVPELPLLGRGSVKVGLSLWKHPAPELLLELTLLAAGLWLYLRAVRLPHARKVVLVAVLGIIAAMTIVGLVVPMPPAHPRGAALSWILTPMLLAAVGFWIERPQQVSGIPK